MSSCNFGTQGVIQFSLSYSCQTFALTCKYCVMHRFCILYVCCHCFSVKCLLFYCLHYVPYITQADKAHNILTMLESLVFGSIKPVEVIILLELSQSCACLVGQYSVHNPVPHVPKKHYLKVHMLG